MKFDNIDGNRRLWAVKYDENAVNVLSMLFCQWSDVDWLADFFSSNKADLERNFQIRSVDKAIYDTLKDAEELERMEEVRNHLIDNGVTDLDGFIDFVKHN